MISPFLEELRSDAWAMEPKKLEALAQKAAAFTPEAFARRGLVDPETTFGDGISAKLPGLGGFEVPSKGYKLDEDGIATVRVSGVLMRNVPTWYSWAGIEATRVSDVRDAVTAAAADDRAERIVLLIDSPGGQAQGVQEVGEAIYQARKHKNVAAIVDGMCASGAYWLASQAHSITAAEDAFCGSIGVFQVFADFSKAAEDSGVKVHVVRSGEHKGMGTMGAPITAEQLGAMQELVDGFAGIFTKAVARGRGMTQEDAALRATGQLWLAGDAKKQGLVDEVEPVTKALSRLVPQKKGKAMAETTTPNPQAQEPAVSPVEAARAADRKRLADLKAAFKDDLPFAVAQFEAGAGVEQAKAAYADILGEKLKASEAARVAATADLEKEKAARKTVAPAGGILTPHSSVDPATVSSSAPDFMAKAKDLADKKKLPLRIAMSEVARSDPAGHVEWLESRPLVRLNKERRYERSGEKVPR